MSTFDSTGLTVDRQADLVTSLTALFKASFGDDIKTDADSVFGQLIQNLALTLAEQNELAESIANAFDPQSASGAALSNLVLFNGIQRQEAVYSTVSLNCTATAALTIPAGSLVENVDTGVQWATDSDLVFTGAGSSAVTATCTEEGAVTATAGKLTVIVNPLSGWSAVTNPAAATVGQVEETDAALRIRRQNVAERASTVSVSAIIGAITDLDGVDTVDVLVNRGTATDANGVPPQHIWCILPASGGTNADIAEAIFDHTALGIGTVGSTTVSHTDSTSGDSYDVKFSRATQITINIDIDITVDSDYPADGDDQIKAALVAYFDDLTPGDDVKNSRLYTPCNTVAGHTINTLYIAAAPTDPAVAAADIAIDVDEIAVTATGNITITQS